MRKTIRLTESDLIRLVKKIISESNKLTIDDWEDIWFKLRKIDKSFGRPDDGIFPFGGLFFFYSKDGELRLPPQKLSDWREDTKHAADILDNYVRRLTNSFEESGLDLRFEVDNDYSMKISYKNE